MSKATRLWKKIVRELALELGFKVRDEFIICTTLQGKLEFALEEEKDSLFIHHQNMPNPRQISSSIECLDFCQWLRTIEHQA